MKKVLSIFIILLLLSTAFIAVKADKKIGYHAENIYNGDSWIERIIHNDDGTISVIVRAGKRCSVYTLKDNEKLFDVIDVK